MVVYSFPAYKLPHICEGNAPIAACRSGTGGVFHFRRLPVTEGAFLFSGDLYRKTVKKRIVLYALIRWIPCRNSSMFFGNADHKF